MENIIESQSKMILAHLKKGQAITPIEALQLYGCFRLGARIWDLKGAGHRIRTDIVTVGKKRFASYSLEDFNANV
jgi:hypothetical protein